MARWCALQGWPVHPLAPGRKTPAANCPACRGRSHDPRTCPCPAEGRACHGFHAATTDQERIDTWWGRSPAAGVGVACGPAGLVVLDVDAHPAPVPDRSRLLPGIPIHETVDLAGLASGFDTLALLAAFRGQPDPARDEDTLRVRTPSGGLHIWYRVPEPGTRFRCSTGSSAKVALAWQVDVRAHGGYIVAPTTRTAQGTYEVQGPARTPAPLPAWLHTELVRTGHLVTLAGPQPPVGPQPPAGRQQAAGAPQTVGGGAARRRGRGTAARRVLEPLLAEVVRCGTAPEGTGFTEKLNRAAYTAGGLAAAGHLEHAGIREELLAAAHSARPWQDRRNEKIIDDGLAAGRARPFHLEGRT
ncbi:DNA primase (plasmid) [Streptomyces incarnatus]|uniref:DNA primase n=1 Tax=Streptomyces incarnatus TaxID=665007 RepID=A0ABN4GVP3_9ACTN|nr:bifunctional DNA primase/polymerase [Streptomyces incarnatus]AKJ15887.1 DNA primase [Streptomyces incarnatus]